VETPRNKSWFMVLVLGTEQLTGLRVEAAFMHPEDICELIATLLPEEFVVFSSVHEGALVLCNIPIYPRLEVVPGANPVFLSREPICTH